MLHRALLLSIVLSAICCCAQLRSFDNSAPSFDMRSTFSGSVHDAAGQPVSGARVEVVNPETQRSVAVGFTEPNGAFQIENVRQGDYDVVITCGLAESRAHVDIYGTREVSLQLGTAAQAGAPQGPISVTQMNVPNKARGLLQKAESAFRKSHIDEAFSFVQKALTCYPNYAKALVLRGILNMQKGDDKDAQPDLEKAVQLDYTDDIGYVALASLYNNEGQFDHAEQTLDHGMPLHPTSWQASLEMARAQIGKKDFGSAVRSLDRAAMFAPPTVTLVHLYRAQAFIGLQDYKGAIGELETYLTKSPNDPNSEMARSTLTKLKEFTASAQK